MNTQDFSLINGFPLNQAALARMQTAYSIFNALGSIAGDKTIISGCNVVGANTTNGVVYVNGEVFEFRGGSTQSKVIVKEDVTNLVYKNNNSYPAVKTRYVTFGAGVGAIDWVDFKRGFDTKDIAEGLANKADQNSFEALADAFVLVYEKMLTIEEGAQKNPTGIINYLAKGVFTIGDSPATDSIITVPIQDVGTNNYMVLGSMVSKSSNYNSDNDVIWSIREKRNTSFKITMREVSANLQDLDFEYMLIPL